MPKKLIYFFSAAIISLMAIYLIAGKMTSIDVEGQKEIFIKSGSSYTEVVSDLDSILGIRHKRLFDWLAHRKNYPDLVKAGRYLAAGRLNYNELINMLRSGRQTPVKVTFNNIRTLDQLAGRIGGRIEADSASIADFLNNESNYSADGFSRATIISVFLPNTYQMFWNTDPSGLYRRMLKEYNAFWTDEKKAKAKKMGLSPVEASILASIVDDEVAKKDEKPRIAGVYLNRLKKGMPLQSCPTIKFALNDFSITRVLKKYLTVDSPYNTYMYRGLPPGPVGCPSIQGIDAVLNAEDHDYYYFAAKADFSGYHNFSRTLQEHNRYAAAYQKELDKRKIFK